MIGKVLIVAAAEGFIIKGLETKLNGISVGSEYSSPKMADVGSKCKDIDIIILYTDGDVANASDSLVYIKDFCSEKDKQVIVIGTNEEYEIVRKFIPEKLVFKFYERPLDMGVLLKDVEKYLDAEVQSSRKKNILIVDDDVSYMSMIMNWLKDQYRVSLANSGMEAITWLAKNRADLILLDYEMPITSGPQVLEMIRSSASTSDIPVMFLTGKSDKESVMKVLSLKPVGYLLKNVDRSELRDTLSKFFITSS